MNQIENITANSPAATEQAPTITRKFGRTTCQVYVHFSETSKETLKDKVERLISNEIHFTDLS